MADKRVGIIVNGATGRIARTQHLARALLPIIEEKGLALADGNRAVPDLLLAGRDEGRLANLAGETGLQKWTTDVDAALADPAFSIYFDAAITQGREERLSKAMAAGKDIYTEKPIAGSLQGARALLKQADAAGIRHGVVSDKIFLRGLKKLKRLLDTGSLGRLLSVKLEFGWWIFDGFKEPCQRPSWNYRKKDGGGLVLDMFPHWTYILGHLFGDVRDIYCRTATHIPQRQDEAGNPYAVDVEDSAYALLTLEGGVPVQLSTSWATRVRRDNLWTIQADGTDGSAVATVGDCWFQSLENTPNPVIDTVQGQQMDLFGTWSPEPEVEPFQHSFRPGWELFLRHVLEDAPFPFPLGAGINAIRLIDAAYRSARERRVVDLDETAAP